MKILNFMAGLQIRASEGGRPRRFSILAYSGGLLPVDGFDKPVIVDLSGLEVPGAIPILIDHEKSVEATLGITDQINNDVQGLLWAARSQAKARRLRQFWQLMPVVTDGRHLSVPEFWNRKKSPPVNRWW